MRIFGPSERLHVFQRNEVLLPRRHVDVMAGFGFRGCRSTPKALPCRKGLLPPSCRKPVPEKRDRVVDGRLGWFRFGRY